MEFLVSAPSKDVRAIPHLGNRIHVDWPLPVLGNMAFISGIRITNHSLESYSKQARNAWFLFYCRPLMWSGPVWSVPVRQAGIFVFRWVCFDVSHQPPVVFTVGA